MKLTNRQHGYIIRLKDRCEVLRARVRAGNYSQLNYIGDWERELHALEWAVSALEADPAAEYAKRNPLGGPAKVFEAMASCIRAGDDFYAVLDDFGFMVKPAHNDHPLRHFDHTCAACVAESRLPQERAE